MKTRLKSPKTIEKQWKAYVKSLEQGWPKSPKMEALRPFMGARGKILKRNTRSNKQRAAYNKAVEDIQKTYKKKTKQPFIKAEKQKKTAARNAVKKHQKKQHKKQTGTPLTKTAKKIAQEAEDKYSRMLDILTEGSQQLLSSKVRYEIYKKMDAEGVSDEDIKAFIEKLLETLEDIPEEAKELAKNDDYVQTLMQLSEFSDAEKDNFQAMFVAMIQSEEEDQEDIKTAIRWWESNDTGMSFAQFWAELEMYNDKGNIDNYEEIVEGKRD